MKALPALVFAPLIALAVFGCAKNQTVKQEVINVSDGQNMTFHNINGRKPQRVALVVTGEIEGTAAVTFGKEAPKVIKGKVNSVQNIPWSSPSVDVVYQPDKVKRGSLTFTVTFQN